MTDQSYIFKLSMDGELLAEAPLIIHDEKKAWQCFQAVFSAMTGNLVGEFYESMRIACDPELRKSTGNKPGFSVDLQTKPKSDIIIPQMQVPGQRSSDPSPLGLLAGHNGAANGHK